MIVHISLFFLKDPEKDSAAMKAALDKVPQENDKVVTSWVGNNLVKLPPIPGVPEFGDVAQVITFANAEDAAGYAESAAHVHLRETTDDLIAKVVGAEYEV